MGFTVTTECWLGDFEFDLREPIELELGGNNSPTVTFREIPQGERAVGVGMIGQIRTYHEEPVVEALLRTYTIPTGTPPQLVQSLVAESFPEELHDFSTTVRDVHLRALGRAVRYMRWRLKMWGGFRVVHGITSAGTTWKADDGVGAYVPGKFTGSVSARAAWRSDALAEALATRPEPDSDEPLAHGLLREAWEVRRTTRSAWVIAIAALEVGAKRYIARRVPDAEWLVRELPAPPLFRLLGEYVHQLPSANTIVGKSRLPVSAVEAIKLAVRRRDRLVHVGERDPTAEELEPLLRTVRDILYLLDYYDGATWALEHVHSESLAELGLHPSDSA